MNLKNIHCIPVETQNGFSRLSVCVCVFVSQEYINLLTGLPSAPIEHPSVWCILTTIYQLLYAVINYMIFNVLAEMMAMMCTRVFFFFFFFTGFVHYGIFSRFKPLGYI